jgi:hypothetical protein
MMKQKSLAKSRTLYVIVLLAVVALLAGCQSGPASTDEVVEPDQGQEEPPAVAEDPTTLPEPTSEPESDEEAAITQITSAGEMAGIWLGTIAGEKGYVMYTPDGQFAVSLTEDSLTTAPRVTGEYWFENNQIHMRDLENAGHWAACDESIVGVYEVINSEENKVTFQTVDDACSEAGFTRQFLFANMVQERIGDALPLE